MSKPAGLRNMAKKWMHKRILPRVYEKAAGKEPVDEHLALFVSGHGEGLSANLRIMRSLMRKRGFQTRTFSREVDDMNPFRLWQYLRTFMKAYGRARYVFLDSYFLPVSSCQKRPETTVVQLWHSGGLLKKMGYDTPEDLQGLPGGFTDNYDLVTVSDPSLCQIWEKALGLPAGTAAATGLPRTDRYFSSVWRERERARFFRNHPVAKGKKVAVYAPSFRGRGSAPEKTGGEAVMSAMRELEKDWYLVLSPHFLLKKWYPQREKEQETEELFPAADLLITDYSSVAYDAMLLQIPVLYYCPDLETYRKNRGFYLDPESLPGVLAKTPEELTGALRGNDWDTPKKELKQVTDRYMSSCRGGAAKRVLQELENRANMKKESK